MSIHVRNKSFIMLLLLVLFFSARDSIAATAEESQAKINQMAPIETF